MLLLNTHTTDPSFNLAVDEYLLKNRQENFLVLGVNSRSVIIGKHQVAHREVDTQFITTNNIPLFRRISGGGTVFHDEGNLNFSFITNSEKGKQIDFRKYTLPVISFLKELGVDARLEGKNDIRSGGFKISGNAEHVFRERVLHHGTLLFDTDMFFLKGAIRKVTGNYLTRAVSSNPSPVMNLRDLLPDTGNTERFREIMTEWMLKSLPGAESYTLSAEELLIVEEMAIKKYRNWEWNFGYGPEYCFTNSFHFEGKENHVTLKVTDGIIAEISFDGNDRLAQASRELIGCRHMPEDILEATQGKNILPESFNIYNLF